ncbi:MULTISPECIES: hypothetical protein [unclassified Sphingobium]|uniref:hypothetical protein n=1 Tax=unclassified Sphingobium TaxID=2611147 RepID=UPI0007700B9C|nr:MULTISPECIES: hypothetical protein [Sphingomonadaceae]AMK24206.1 hypothetical protein K426_16370 [Sphingobium sp. TKS]NML91967.1 hypothetical protein [Sphingobium sp. TB-6]
MTPTPYRNEAGPGGLPFILSLWLSLGVALLSALAPLGPPSSRITGSAFNPATTGVVLKARADANPIALRVTEPDGDGRAPALAPAAIWFLPVAALPPGAALLLPARRLSPSFPSPKPFHLLSRQRARAPPAFS